MNCRQRSPVMETKKQWHRDKRIPGEAKILTKEHWHRNKKRLVKKQRNVDRETTKYWHTNKE